MQFLNCQSILDTRVENISWGLHPSEFDFRHVERFLIASSRSLFSTCHLLEDGVFFFLAHFYKYFSWHTRYKNAFFGPPSSSNKLSFYSPNDRFEILDHVYTSQARQKILTKTLLEPFLRGKLPKICPLRPRHLNRKQLFHLPLFWKCIIEQSKLFDDKATGAANLARCLKVFQIGPEEFCKSEMFCWVTWCWCKQKLMISIIKTHLFSQSNHK